MDVAEEAAAGRNLSQPRETLPLSRAPTLPDADLHFRYFKAVHCMHFVLLTGETILAGPIPENVYDTFMARAPEFNSNTQPSQPWTKS